MNHTHSIPNLFGVNPAMANLSFFVFSLLFCTVASSSPVLPNLKLPSFSRFPYSDAESLIRALNIFPKDATPQSSSNIPQLGENRIVEKKLKFPFLASDGNSVEELGHHAGYYRLNNTKDARFSLFIIYPFYFRFSPKSGTLDFEVT